MKQHSTTSIDQPRSGRLHFASMVPAAVVSAFLVPGIGQGADTSSPGTSASDTLSDVVVTATRREERSLDVPVSVSALSGDSLEVLGTSGQDIKQLAFRVPSLNIESSNGRAFPRFYIRGYGNTDFHDFASQPVSLVYDDIVQENPALKGFPIFDQADVEVLRGPQGTLFGRNSPAGVVKLESAKPKLRDTSGYLTLSDGTFNSANIEAVVNLPINDQMAFRASVQGQHRNNWINDPTNLTKLGGYDDWAARLQLLYTPSDQFSALVNVHGRSLDGSSTVFRANIITFGTNQLVPGFDPKVTYSDGPNSATLNTLGANVHLTWDLPSLTLQSISGYETVQNYLSVGDIDGGFGPGFFSGSALPSGPGPIPFAVQTSAGVLDHEQLTQEFRVVSENSGPLRGQAGVFLFYENVAAADDNYCVPGGSAPSCGALLWTLQDTTAARQKNDAEAIFGSLEYTVTSAFKARAGVRYTADHKTFDVLYSTAANPPSPPDHASQGARNVSWDVSATYAVEPDVNVYARIATGFRAPSFGTPSAGIPIQLAKSEKNISYEAGVKAELFDRRARIAFDVYYYNVSDQQLTAVGGAANQTLLINAAHTIGKGAELDFEAHLLPNLTFNVSGSLNDTQIDDPGLTVAPCFNWGGTDQCHVLNPLTQFDPKHPLAPVGNAEINGNPLPQAAKYIGDVSLRYDFPLANNSLLYVYTDWSYRSSVNFGLYRSAEFTGQPLTQGGVRLGYSWAEGKYDVAAFCRNCANQIRIIGGIDFENTTGYINDPRIFGAQLRVKF